MTVFSFHLISGMAVGLEFVGREQAGVATVVIDIVILRILIQHGNPEDFEDIDEE